ncbi:hypothetical protein SDC9_13887 [bioreactor metagenome]|uniref:Uncharacterized protein n=1 Tax=bioreactor metagenome TaxID=1076179 RepID=A0A644TMR7_9ZZZZ|nr:hypothetical protein [Negativicutes bacterium]
MKKFAVSALIAVMTLAGSTAFASLDDTKTTIANYYGEYRMAIDTDNQLWPHQEWEQKGQKRAKAASYTYSFERQGLGVQMEVKYLNDRPEAPVVAQRFTPNMAIQIKDLKTYFPEIYQLVTAPQAEAFASYDPITRQFQEIQSPVTMGVVIKEQPVLHRGNYTLLAFNIQDEGRLIKDPKYIDENTYIREFTIEKVMRTTVNDNIEHLSWKSIKNFF